MERIDRRLAQHVDWALALLAVLVVALGSTTVYSATFSQADGQPSPLFYRQLAWAGLGVGGMVVTLCFDYRKLERYAYLLYGAAVALLAMVPIVGIIGGGSRRWIHLGVFALQPSELMKLSLVIVLAHFFQTEGTRETYRLRDLAVPTVLYSVPAVLILAQPDLGSALLLGFVFASMVVVAGIRLRSLLYLVVVGSIAVFVAGNALWGHLKPYQQKRIVTFLNPEADPLGSGYHIIQSEIAVGSGKVWGKGFLKGTQNKLNFLPEQHTDFIFSVYAEEWGFGGCVVLMLLYLALVWRGLEVVARAKERFGALLAFGVTAIVFWQAFINMAMAMGMVPVVGITLPLFSYGGSSMMTLLIGLALLLNVSMRRFMF
ncbi:MAG: rod shape determining protein RodA [Candidatus Binatota bacterium]|jgi:rod shape determining protein RodA|nr:rod shape determining protein RodA [Candidatus Binatota bacterium]